MAQYFYVHGIKYKVFAPAKHFIVAHGIQYKVFAPAKQFIVALGNKTAAPWLK